jgi:two-component system phosphate regulon sensor histidine kinase PhoR
MQYPLAQQGFTLNVSIADGVAALPADSDALEQAILNLLSNAMKYSGSAREIDLSLRSGDGEAVIEVCDQGIGIDAQEQSRIFEKFYRSRSADTERVAGTGLGLTVVQHVVQAHGGRVELQSAPGRGSTFSIRIPFSKSEAPA